MRLRDLRLYPAQGCGLPYMKFRAGNTWRDAYEALAYRRHGLEERTFKPSAKKIKITLAKMKRAAYEVYLRDCEMNRKMARGGGELSPAQEEEYAQDTYSADTSFDPATFSGLWRRARARRRRR
jgi:hypothetical protein